MNASDRAQYLRVKRASANLTITDAERAELVELEAAGHVKGSGDAKPRSTTPERQRRPDPVAIAGEINTSTSPTLADCDKCRQTHRIHSGASVPACGCGGQLVKR